MNKEMIDGIIDILLKMKTNSKIILKNEDKKKDVEIGFAEIIELIKSLSPDKTNERIILKSLDYLQANKMFNNQSTALLDSIKIASGNNWIIMMIKLFNKRYPILLDEYFLNDISNIFSNDLKIDLSNLYCKDSMVDEDCINFYLDTIFNAYSTMEITKKYSEQDIAITSYLWFVLSQRKDSENYNFKRIQIFDQMFVAYLARIKTNEINDRCSRIVPIQLEKKEFRKLYKNLQFLHHENWINEKRLEKTNLEKSMLIESQKTKIKMLENSQLVLKENIATLTNNLIDKDFQINELSEQIKELEKKLSIEKGKLQFEENKHESQMQALEKDILKELRNDFRVDLENINNIIFYIDDERIKTKLKNRLDNINSKLNKY